jgi:signal transduction histidine kinase
MVRVDGSQPDGVTVQVHNMGAIPEEMVPRLFDPMAGGSPRREKSQGLGLGLFISEQILKAHGGSLHVETSEEKGTTFSARLPRDARPAVEELAS